MAAIAAALHWRNLARDLEARPQRVLCLARGDAAQRLSALRRTAA